MKKTGYIVTVSVLVCAAMMVGCTKKVEVTIANHSDHSRTVSLTVPDGTTTVGAVGAASSLTHTLAVKNEDLPAQCNYSAGAGSSQSFALTEDSPDRWWFHITKDGRITRPYTKEDTHVETEDRGEVELEVHREMKIK